MDFAVVKIAGKQQLVRVGEKIAVNDTGMKVGEEITIKDVLLVAKDDDVKVGTPLVEKGKVTAKVLAVGKGDKVRVAKFKAKSRYRRVMGFRPAETQLEVLSIGDSSPSKPKIK